MRWSVAYRPEWDERPDAYVEHGVVGWGRTRRLGRLALPEIGLVAYVGAQHVDPPRWGRAGEPASRFFASCRQGGRVWLRTFPTMAAALAALPPTEGEQAPA
jgi:hypothetical protein